MARSKSADWLSPSGSPNELRPRSCGRSGYWLSTASGISLTKYRRQDALESAHFDDNWVDCSYLAHWREPK